MDYLIIGIIGSYLIGSIPTAYLFGRILKGIDIRKFGSGNVGATNALRVLGKPAGISVLILDIIKGFVPVFFLGNLLISRIPFPSEITRIIFGFACISGHNWTIFLKFKGGKGVATTLGVLLGLAFKIKGLNIVLGLMILVWLCIFIITRIVSLASIISSIFLPLFMLLSKQSAALIIASIILTFFIILRHRANLKRLLQGKEARLTFKTRQS